MAPCSKLSEWIPIWRLFIEESSACGSLALHASWQI